MKFLDSELPMPIDEDFDMRYYDATERDALNPIVLPYSGFIEAMDYSILLEIMSEKRNVKVEDDNVKMEDDGDATPEVKQEVATEVCFALSFEHRDGCFVFFGIDTNVYPWTVLRRGQREAP